MKCLTIEGKGKMCILQHTGELTLETIPEVKKETEPYMDDDENQKLVIDLSKTTFLDSSGIGFLVHVNNRMRSRNKKLYLLNLSPQVKKSLSLVRLLDFFNIVENENALEALLEGESKQG
ncbi:MAG: STAS domain-containing protein [Desulfohalobiaceae bacterium]|nr:STAS domain-containing protein [Desulfohalobiaceae bacterium]